MPRLNILLLLLLVSTTGALAEHCPADFALSGEHDLANHYKAILCWKQTSSNAGELRSILSSPTLSTPIVASFVVETENQITNVAFEEKSLTLKKGQVTLPVLVESRVHESDHDEDITDLWLLQFDGKAINRIFATQTQYASWATLCKSDCRATERMTTTLTLGAPQANGFSNITLQKTATMIPYDLPDNKGSSQKSTEEYQFNGKEYLAL